MARRLAESEAALTMGNAVTTEPRCCGGGDYYGDEPYCDFEKATAKHIAELESALARAREALEAIKRMGHMAWPPKCPCCIARAALGETVP